MTPCIECFKKGYFSYLSHKQINRIKTIKNENLFEHLPKWIDLL